MKTTLRYNDWKQLRAIVNHDFLQNRYLTFIAARNNEISNLDSANIRARVSEWNDNLAQIRTLIDNAEASLSPSQLIEVAPLNALDPNYKYWLSDAIHAVFVSKTSMKQHVTELSDMMDVITKLIDDILAGNAGDTPGVKLYDLCKQFSAKISALPNKIIIL